MKNKKNDSEKIPKIIVKKTYYKSGKLKSEGYSKNGKLDGEWKSYYESGKLKCEGIYTEGKRTGKWKGYFENGNLKSEEPYENDLLEGIWKIYFESGELYSEAEFQNNEANGFVKYYSCDNSDVPLIIDAYRNGQKIDPEYLHKIKVVDINLDTDSQIKMSLEEPIEKWQDFYREVFKVDYDFSKIKIPEKQAGFNKLIIMGKGITAQQIFDKCREYFKVLQQDEDFFNSVISDRSSIEKSYAVWVHETLEADKEFKNLSAIDIKEKGIAVETLEERMMEELVYFNKYGKFADIKNVTLLSGSRFPDGYIPILNCIDRKMSVSIAESESHHRGLRARRVIT